MMTPEETCERAEVLSRLAMEARGDIASAMKVLAMAVYITLRKATVSPDADYLNAVEAMFSESIRPAKHRIV